MKQCIIDKERIIQQGMYNKLMSIYKCFVDSRK